MPPQYGVQTDLYSRLIFFFLEYLDLFLQGTQFGTFILFLCIGKLLGKLRSFPICIIYMQAVFPADETFYFVMS